MNPRTDPRTNEELVSQAAGGNDEAFRILVERYEKTVYNLVLRYLNDPDESFDVAQEVFINLYKNLQKFDPAYKFTTWLYKIASNQALYRYRSRKKRSNILNIDHPDVEQGTMSAEEHRSFSPEETAIQRDRRAQIGKLLDQLDEKYRMAIILRHYMDMSYEEIQQVMNLPIGSVKTNLFRARAKLRELMDQSGNMTE